MLRSAVFGGVSKKIKRPQISWDLRPFLHLCIEGPQWRHAVLHEIIVVRASPFFCRDRSR
jgi:hypothetical protein